MEAAGPVAGMETTADGGGLWSDFGRLPWMGAISFTTPALGWLGQDASRLGWSWARLYRTSDGGHNWSRVFPAVPPGQSRSVKSAALPVFFGVEIGVEPVTLVRRPREWVVFDRTTDGGSTWSIAGIRPLGVAEPREPLSTIAMTAIPSPSTWWVVSAGPSPHTFVTADGGRSWTVAAAPPGQIWSLSAIGPRAAWAITRPGRLWQTLDAGRHWRPLRPAASR